MRNDKGLVLAAPALVPLEEFAAEGQSAEDRYLFAFLLGPTGRASQRRSPPSQAESAGYLVHLTAGSWARPRVWIPLGPLTLKSEGPAALPLEIGGQDRDRQPLTCTTMLRARTPQQVEADFHSVIYLHAESAPGGRLGLRSPTRSQTMIIDASEWRDVWINATDIYLPGWITREQFRQRARFVPEGRHVLQFHRTRTKNLAVPVSDLKPMAQLFDRQRGGRLE